MRCDQRSSFLHAMLQPMAYKSAVSMLMQLTPIVLKNRFSVQSILNLLTSSVWVVPQKVLRVKVNFSLWVLYTIFSTQFYLMRRCLCMARSIRKSARTATIPLITFPSVVFSMLILNLGSFLADQSNEQRTSPIAARYSVTLIMWEQKGFPYVSQTRMFIYFFSRSSNKMAYFSSYFSLVYFSWIRASYFLRLWSGWLPSRLFIICIFILVLMLARSFRCCCGPPSFSGFWELKPGAQPLPLVRSHGDANEPINGSPNLLSLLSAIIINVNFIHPQTQKYQWLSCSPTMSPSLCSTHSTVIESIGIQLLTPALSANLPTMNLSSLAQNKATLVSNSLMLLVSCLCWGASGSGRVGVQGWLQLQTWQNITQTSRKCIVSLDFKYSRVCFLSPQCILALRSLMTSRISSFLSSLWWKWNSWVPFQQYTSNSTVLVWLYLTSANTDQSSIRCWKFWSVLTKVHQLQNFSVPSCECGPPIMQVVLPPSQTRNMGPAPLLLFCLETVVPLTRGSLAFFCSTVLYTAISISLGWLACTPQAANLDNMYSQSLRVMGSMQHSSLTMGLAAATVQQIQQETKGMRVTAACWQTATAS